MIWPPFRAALLLHSNRQSAGVVALVALFDEAIWVGRGADAADAGLRSAHAHLEANEEILDRVAVAADWTDAEYGTATAAIPACRRLSHAHVLDRSAYLYLHLKRSLGRA